MKEKSAVDKIFPFLIIATIIVGVAGLVMISGSKDGFVLGDVFDLDNSNAFSKGSDNPKVVITEFSDFQCPACRSIQPLLRQLLVEYPQDVKLYYRHFPLQQHQYARRAAEAAEAAGEQGKFWQMHDLIFENQENLSDEDFKKFAERLGLDMERFNQALDSGKFREKVSADLSEGRRAAVNSTPSLFINGKKIQFNNFDDLRNIIEEEINNEQQ